MALVAWGKGRSKAGTWAESEGRRGRTWAWADSAADFLRDLAGRLRVWVIADTGPGRLLPWLPVAFGLGIAIYFTADREPVWWVAGSLAIALAIVTFLARRRPIGFPVALVTTSMAAGFAAAALKAFLVAQPVLLFPVSNVDIAGFVEVREERDRSDRIVVRALKLEAARIQQKPDRVRVSVKKGTAPPVGSYVTFRARLTPPLAQLRPGGYDFARDLISSALAPSASFRARSRLRNRRRSAGSGSTTPRRSRGFATESTRASVQQFLATTAPSLPR